MNLTPQRTTASDGISPVCPSWCDHHRLNDGIWEHGSPKSALSDFNGDAIQVDLGQVTTTDGGNVPGQPVCLHIGEHVTLTMGEAARLRDVLTRLTRQGLS
jgi:hypothetical protein